MHSESKSADDSYLGASTGESWVDGVDSSTVANVEITVEAFVEDLRGLVSPSFDASGVWSSEARCSRMDGGSDGSAGLWRFADELLRTVEGGGDFSRGETGHDGVSLDGSPEPFVRCERGSLDDGSAEGWSAGKDAFARARCIVAADGEVGRFGCRCGLTSWLFFRERAPLDGFEVGAAADGAAGPAGDVSRDERGELRPLCEALAGRGPLGSVDERAD
jgi:hypothetical protein